MDGITPRQPNNQQPSFQQPQRPSWVPQDKPVQPTVQAPDSAPTPIDLEPKEFIVQNSTTEPQSLIQQEPQPVLDRHVVEQVDYSKFLQSQTTPPVTSEVQVEPIAASILEPSVVFEEPVIESILPVVEAPTEKVSYADSTIQELEISQIVANPYQPRTQFKQEALEELASSIREHGVIQPLVVTKTPHGYEIVVGERRFRASQLAGLTKIPAIVKTSLHDQTKLEVALIENTQRQDLNAIEEARGYERMIKEFNLTQDQVAKKVGKSRSAVANTLRLLNLPADIQRGVIEGKISEGHARAILGLPDIEKMILMYTTILEQGLNVRQVEAKVREIVVRRRIDAATPDPKLMAIETELRGKLGAQVKISRQGRGGKITIDFYSDEDLEEIMNRMAEQQSGKDDSYFTV